MKKFCVVLCLLSMVFYGFARPQAAKDRDEYQKNIPLSYYWLEPSAVPVNLLDTTFFHKVVDTSTCKILSHVLYHTPIPDVDLDVCYRSLWKPDSFFSRSIFDTVYTDFLRNSLYSSYWGVDPLVPFSQTRNMLKLENVRDTLLLRKRRGQYYRMSDLNYELKVDMLRGAKLVKKVRKPLINPKDSVTRWAFNCSGGINLAQTALVNWAAGGESSVAGNGRLAMDLTYRRGGHKWETALKTEYGLLYDKTNAWTKTVDNLLFSMRYGYAIPGGRFFYTAYMDFQTQYDDGYANVGDENYISTFLSPAYLNISLGMEYKLGSLLSVFAAPLSSRSTFVKDNYLSSIGSFGLEPGDHAKYEVGFSLTSALEWKFWKNMGIKTDASFFTPYDENFGKVVVDWNFYINLYVNEIFKATVGTSLKYDHNVTTLDANGIVQPAKVQFKEMITVGIGYTFKYKSKQREY